MCSSSPLAVTGRDQDVVGPPQNRSTFMFAVQQVHLCMEQGVFVKDDPLETSIMVWAEAHGLVTLFRMERFGADAAEFRAVFRRTIDRMLQGLRPR